MRYLLSFATLLLAFPLLAAEPPKGFAPLFNGKTLDGWHAWNIHAKDPPPGNSGSRPIARSRSTAYCRFARKRSSVSGAGASESSRAATCWHTGGT